jgi:hypothetical protein
MNLLSRLLLRLGYVRLRDYGYTLTPDGRIVELPRVTDDRFAPPPWEPIAWQGDHEFLPPPSPPTPRPLPPPPQGEESLGPGTVVTPGTPAPASFAVAGAIAVAPAAAPPLPHHAMPARTEVEEEEWEWRVALARARERAAADARAASHAPRPPAAVKRTGPMHLPPLPPHPATSGDTRPVGLNRAATQIGAGPGRPPAGTNAPHPVGSPRTGTFLVPALSAITATIGRPSGGPASSPDVEADRTELRSIESPDLELDPDLDLEVEPAGREDGSDFADGSNRHAIARARPGDVTATDMPAAPRPAAPSRDEDDTTVDSTADRLGRALRAESDPIDDSTQIDTATNVVALVPPPGSVDTPLPRVTARLRRPTVP